MKYRPDTLSDGWGLERPACTRELGRLACGRRVRDRAAAIMSPAPVIRWGLEWRSDNKLDGHRCWLVMRNLCPALFKTRRQARDFREEQYGYIAKRADLRREPHGWAPPKIVKVECRVIA